MSESPAAEPAPDHSYICTALQDHGVFLQQTEQKNAQEQLMANPEMMTDMLKKNMGGIVPQVCLRARLICPQPWTWA